MKVPVILIFIPAVLVFGRTSVPQNSYCQSPSTSRCFQDYYWREYDGEIPCDAVPGGQSPDGSTYYIGQAWTAKYGINPATILGAERIAISSSFHMTLRTSNYVKILCSPNKDRFKWILTDVDKVQSITQTKLVLGGNDLYIGRTYYQNAQRLGKVSIHPRASERGLWLPDPVNNREVNLHTYEILTYDCQNYGGIYPPQPQPLPSPLPINPVLSNSPDYYWKDYVNGVIPSQAVVGGREYISGGVLYIGQVYVDRYGILPATIYPEKQIALAQAGNAVYKQTTNIKIFCTNHPEKLKWVPVQSSTLWTVPGKIVGGYEKDIPLFIGRITKEGSDYIGKVFMDNRANKGLWYVYKNKRANSLTYDVLAFEVQGNLHQKVALDHGDGNNSTSLLLPLDGKDTEKPTEIPARISE